MLTSLFLFFLIPLCWFNLAREKHFAELYFLLSALFSILFQGEIGEKGQKVNKLLFIYFF